MRINCIIDTCSCIYLTKAEFRQKPLLRHLHETANLNYCREVSLEVRDHSDKGLPTFIQHDKLKIRTEKHSMDDYERKMLGKTLPSRKKGGNKGEVDNFLVAVDQVHYLKKSAPVFITDDENSLNGILSGWIDSFPAIKVWTSFEVILFLYAEKVIPSKDIAVDLLREIISFKAKAAGGRSEDLTNKLTKTLALYNKRIENIGKLLN